MPTYQQLHGGKIFNIQIKIMEMDNLKKIKKILR